MALTPIDEEQIIDEPVAEEAKPRFTPIGDDEFFGIGGEEVAQEQAVEPVVEEAATPVEAPKSRFTPIEDEELFGIPQQEEPIPVTGEEGILRQAADIPLKIGESINSSLKGLTDLFGADNPISQNLTQNADWYRGLLSAQALEDEQEVGRILQEAENEGLLGQLGAGLEAFSVAPVDFVASGLGSLAVFAAGGLAGRAAGLGAKGIQAVQAGLGAGMGAGIVKGEIYQSVKDEMLAQGKTEEEARKTAMEAQSFTGKNLDQILIGAGLGTIDAYTGAEKIIGKVLAKGGLKPDAGRIANIIKNGLTEAAPEFIQASQEKFASNLALQREGVNVPLTQGVFSQGALEGLVGLGLGAGAGAIEPRVQTPPTKEEVSAAAAETQDVARQNKDIVPATASLVEGEAEQILQGQAETPEQRVARLQREAEAVAGEIPLEEAPVEALPPQPVTPTPEAAAVPEATQAAQARITEREGQAVTPVETSAGNRVEAAAYQAPDGTVYYAADHLGAMAKARDAGKIDQAEIDAKQETTSRETPEFGFATNADPFVTRDQAETIARQSGQITVEQPATGKLHSNEVSLDAFAQPAPTPEAVQPITATRTVADAIRDKDTFIYNGQRGAVSVEDGVTVFRPFGTQEKFEIGINPNQTIGEIEGIQWARKGQTRVGPIEAKPETATIIESQPVITTDEVDQAEPDFEVPVSLIEIEKSKTLNDLADLFDTGDSKVAQEGKRARKVSEMPEFYRQATPQQIDLAKQLIDNALRIIDALPISDQQKQDMAEPFLLLDQDINNYENNPEYQRYKSSIRTEVRPDGEVSAFPTTETEVAAWIKESEQRAAAEAERIRGPQPILTEEQQKQNEIEAIAKEWGTDKETAIKVFNNEVFKVPSGLVKTEWTPPSGWFFEKYGNEIYAIPQTVVKNRIAAQGELRRLSILERAALSGLLTEQRLVNETDAKSYISDAKSQGFTDDDIAAAAAEAQAKWNERFGDNGNARQVAGELPPPVVNVAAEETERSTKPRVTGGSALPSSKLFGMTAREALQYLADQNLGASDMEREGRPLNLSQLMQRAASVLAKMPLRILDADFIMKARGGSRAYRANEGFIRLPATVRGEEYFEDPATLVHEVGHTLTADAIRKYVFDRATANARGSTYSRALDQALANPNTPEQIKKLVSLYKQTLDELGLAEQYLGAGGLADLDATRSQKSAWNRKKPLINKFTGKKIGWSELYALANLDEFVAQAWSSPAFQDMLKSIKVKNQPSLFEKFVSIIRDLFGFDSDTMAAAVIDASYSLAQLEAPATGGTIEERIAATTAARGAAPEAGGTVPLSPIDQYAPRTDEEEKSFNKALSNKVLARNPELAVAAVRLKNGEITAGEYADLVDAIDPFVAKGADPIPTQEKIKQYIAADKVPMVGAKIENGKEVEFRIDIPTYNRSTASGDPVYAITAHEPVAEDAKRVGAPISYMGVAKVLNPTFMTRAISGRGAAIEIAVGAGKFPLATVKGNYEAIADLPTDINDPEVWTEVGYNPIRSSFFVDTRSGDAVISGSEAIMVGSRVFVKNAQMEARPEGVTMGAAYAPEPEPKAPTFAEGSPESATLKAMEASMAKVDAASEAKGGRPETQKISTIASNWMDQGGDERALQDAIVENTNLTPANAARVAKAIARQYDIQQSIATAFLETQTGLSVEALPEGVTLPKEVDPDRPKPVMQRLFDVFMGVRVPPTKLTVNEKAALKDQIRLKAAANRAAKAAQKETSDQVIEVIKAMDLRGGVRPKQVQALAKRAAKVIWTNEKSIETFSDYAAKVVENANYDADLREAKAAQARAKQLSKQKKIAAPQREMLDNIAKIAVNRLDDPRMYADAVNYYLRGFKSVLSPDYVVIPDSEMTSYLSQMEGEATRSQKELDSAVNQRLAEKYGVDPDDVNKVLEAVEIIKQIEASENREAMDNLLTDKAIETQDGLKAYDQTLLRSDQRKVVDFMMKVDPRALDAEERQRFIRITNNIIYNNQTNGAEYFASVAKGQQNARQAAQDSAMIAKNKAWINLLPRFISERMQRGWALELQSVADTFRNAFGKGAMAKIYKAMGMLDLNMGFTKANNTIDEIQEKIAEFHRGLEKKYKASARNQDGLLAEGVAGFLIQAVPNKGETESIAQRRDLIKQDIANRRESGEADRMAMADRIEAILNQINGEGVQAVLNNLKQTYPANHESLLWYKDTLFPQYKDFLKNFDENFNDQANNYDNPNYLPIAFSKASPSLAITPEEEQVFFNQVSLTPKQSAYTIKRVDYTTLPTDRTTKRPKEIEFNLRRNAFDSLSDQINKAYTSGAWQQIASFMKTPEAKVVFGGQANQDFFIERLNRLRLSRMRRGAMSRGNIERAVDSLSVISRKLGTGIALGGVYQWIKQPPDQLVTTLGSGGRWDLMRENIMPKNQKAARELLRKFSIGRRGDASAGYKYINQMEGHQNRLERYFSESKWDQVKEEGGKIADVWMAALKQSDFWAASTAWMTYYEGELNKRNIKIEDWAKEAELVDTDPARQEAAAFAEQMTDIYQGSSDPTQMATFAQSGKSGWENLMKAIFVPFNSFAIQQRMRLYSDARDVLNGEKSGAAGLTGTIGGLLLFHATKRLVLPVISGSVAGVLYALLGVDMEEPDEEKKKEEANKRWRQMQGEMLGNLLVGGTPQIVEAKFIDAMNYASYLIALQLESEDILNDEGEVMSFDQYAKERSPFWRYRSFDNAMSLGMLDIGLGQAEQAILQTKMVATPEEMEMYTPEEQRLLYFSTLSEWMYLMRLNDADFARIVSKARRDMMAAAKEREKEIKRIQSGR